MKTAGLQSPVRPLRPLRRWSEGVPVFTSRTWEWYHPALGRKWDAECTAECLTPGGVSRVTSSGPLSSAQSWKPHPAQEHSAWFPELASFCFGLVLLVFFLSFFFLQWKSSNIYKSRKKRTINHQVPTQIQQSSNRGQICFIEILPIFTLKLF